MNNHLVIMAGGVGSRFWPMSTPECPKQFIDVLGVGKTLLQLTAERFAGIIALDHIWIVTSKNYKEIVHKQLPDIPEEQILLEPCMRNTAPCIAYVAWKIRKHFPDADLVVSPADHVVMNIPEFQRVIHQGLDFIHQEDRILTLGMMPSRPDTGYGYIKGIKQTNKEIVKVEAFKEKPDLQTAESYLNEGGYYWNAGIFLWKVDTVIRSIRINEPELAGTFDTLDTFLYTANEQQRVDELFPTCKNISVDYAVMERAENAYVLPADFGWSDLGTWGSLHQQLTPDKNGNAIVGGEVKLIESSQCVVSMPPNKKVVIQGLQGYIIAEKDDTLLICKLEEEQRIKEFSKY